MPVCAFYQPVILASVKLFDTTAYLGTEGEAVFTGCGQIVRWSCSLGVYGAEQCISRKVWNLAKKQKPSISFAP